MNKPDRRSIKSEKAIQKAFIEMLQSEGFDAITIKALTEQADISRKTFYLHYLDKFDLLNKMVDERMVELAELCERKKDKGFVEGTVLWFCYFEEHKAFFKALFATESTIAFRYRLQAFIMAQLNDKLSDAADHNEVLCKFMATAVLGVLESYVLDEFKADIKEIAEQVGVLLEQMIMQAKAADSKQLDFDGQYL